MQHVQTAMQTSLTLRPDGSIDLAPETGGQVLPIPWIEALFERLAAILGAQLADIVAGADPEVVKREWAAALAGFSTDEIRRGITATRTRKFPPNLPAFLHLCRPALDPELAWHEALQGMRERDQGHDFAYSHPAVYWAARGFGVELRSEDFARHRKAWEHRMAGQWQRASWPPIPPSLRRIPVGDAEPTTEGTQAGLERLRRLRERLTPGNIPAPQAGGTPTRGV